MKEKIINELGVLEKSISEIIVSVENNEQERKTIVKVNKIQKKLQLVHCMILKDYLTEISEKSGFSRKKIIECFDLIK